MSNPGWAEAFGKALASQDESERSEVTGLKRRTAWCGNGELRRKSVLRGAQASGKTKLQRELPPLFAEDTEEDKT